MTSFFKVFAPRCALTAALLASACQRDSNATFDDRDLTSSDSGGDAGESDAIAGREARGGASSDGGKASAGAGKSSTSAGRNTGGKSGAGGSGGKGGRSAGGNAPIAGQGGKGGTAGSTSAGGATGGSSEPEPMTFFTVDIDDTQVASCTPSSNYGVEKSMTVDGDSSCKYESLVIVPLKEIPEDALVSSAILVLTCTDVGDSVTVSYVDEAWEELSVHWTTRPALGTKLTTLTCAELGEVSIDLTSAVKAWLGGSHERHGVYLRTEGTDGSDFGTSESSDSAERPSFSVTYTLAGR